MKCKLSEGSEDEIAGSQGDRWARPRGGCSSDVAARLDVKKKRRRMEEKGDGIRRPMMR
jgi:hypothetical protein